MEHAKSQHTKRKRRIHIQNNSAVTQMPCFWCLFSGGDGSLIAPPLHTNGYFITWLEILINTVYARIFDFFYLSIQQ